MGKRGERRDFKRKLKSREFKRKVERKQGFQKKSREKVGISIGRYSKRIAKRK